MEESRIIPKFQVRAAELVRMPFSKSNQEKTYFCIDVGRGVWTF